jgi:hypothetical protein
MTPNPAANHRIRLTAIYPDTDLLTLTKRQRITAPLCLSFPHPTMIVDQTIHRPRTDPRRHSSLINRRTASQREQRTTRHT